MRSLFVRLLVGLLLLCGYGRCVAGAQERIAVLIAGGICDPVSPFARIGSNLEAPPNDVRLMADLLEGRYGFPAANIAILGLNRAQRERLGRGYRFLSDRATRAAILGAVTQQLRGARPNDYVVVYYSGHGAPLFDTDEGIDVGALVTYEGTKETAIRRTDLESRIDACPSRHVTLILDSCFSGLFAKSFPQRPPALEELEGMAALSVEQFSKSLPVRQVSKSASSGSPRSGSAPIRDSVYNFTTLAACDEDEQTQEARFVGGDSPVAVSEFTWALYHTLWQNQAVLTLEDCHTALTRRLTLQRQRQVPQFRRGRQKSELIAPPLWASSIPRLPAVSADVPGLALGRLAGISRSMQFCEEGVKKGAPDPQGAILRVRDLTWFDTTLAPVSGRPRRSRFLLPAPADRPVLKGLQQRFNP